jgi:hypothetical protein
VKRVTLVASSVVALAATVAPHLSGQELLASARTGSTLARVNAQTLFEEGVRLSEQNQLAEACEKFEASEALDVAVGTLLRLGDCRERTGRLASALARFREAGSLAASQGMTDRARIAAVRSAALEHKVARLLLRVPPVLPAGYTLKLGEVTVPKTSWGTPLPLDAGTVTVEASAPGYVTYRRYVAIPPEEGARVRIALPPLEPHRASNQRSRGALSEGLGAPSEEDTGRVARVVGVSLAATGGAGLVTSGVLAVVSKKRHDASDPHCTGIPRDCSPRGDELREESARLLSYAAVSAAIGGSLLVAGLVVYLTAPSERRRDGLALGLSPDARGGWSLQAAGTF